MFTVLSTLSPDSPQPSPRAEELAPDLAALTARLAAAGFVAAEDEARELAEAAALGPGAMDLDHLAERRLTGEPLAWITGRTRFGGLDVRVDSGVYVPRWQSTTLARRAAARLPAQGAAVDLCTGSGAVALLLQQARPRARVVATDIDPAAVACARRNGVDARLGDLFAGVPRELEGRTDVVVAVVPYVPTGALRLLPRDTLRFEEATHYDGGPDGTKVLSRVARDAIHWLRTGGALLLELGGRQAGELGPVLGRLGYTSVETWADEDGDLRGMEATAGERLPP